MFFDIPDCSHSTWMMKSIMLLCMHNSLLLVGFCLVQLHHDTRRLGFVVQSADRAVSRSERIAGVWVVDKMSQT